MKQRNNNKPHRQTEANDRKTQVVIEKYHGKVALLKEWEEMPDEFQIKHHDYILSQRAKIRVLKNMDPTPSRTRCRNLNQF